jgi:hypothetical protein
MTIEKIFAAISAWVILLPLLTGIRIFNRFSKDSYYILFVVFLGTIPSMLKALTSEEHQLNISYNLYTLAEFFLYYKLFETKVTRFKVGFKALLIVYCIISSLFIYQLGIINHFLNELVCINSFIYLGWMLLIILEQYRSEKIDLIFEYENPFVWYFSAILIYSSCTLLYFFLEEYIKSRPEPNMHNLKIIHHVFNILLNIFFTTGLLKDGRTIHYPGKNRLGKDNRSTLNNIA